MRHCIKCGQYFVDDGYSQGWCSGCAPMSKISIRRTNELLERIAVALEALTKKTPEPEKPEPFDPANPNMEARCVTCSHRYASHSNGVDGPCTAGRCDCPSFKGA